MNAGVRIGLGMVAYIAVMLAGLALLGIHPTLREQVLVIVAGVVADIVNEALQ